MTTDTDELVKRLRSFGQPLTDAAADRLEALQAEVVRLKHPFRHADKLDWDSLPKLLHDVSGMGTFWKAVLAEARAVFEGAEGTQVSRLSLPSTDHGVTPRKEGSAISQAGSIDRKGGLSEGGGA